MLKEQKLTEKELRGYRQWLSELDVESREEQESSRQTVDPDIWRVFNPEGNIGRQIYESYTDEALLEAVVGTMDHPGHKPRLYQLSLIRQVYLKQLLKLWCDFFFSRRPPAFFDRLAHAFYQF